MKPQHIKIWPELYSFWPLALPFRREQNIQEIIIEINHCREVTAIGLTAVLIRLIKLLVGKSACWLPAGYDECEAFDRIRDLAFFNHLRHYQKQSLFALDIYSSEISNEPVCQHISDRHIDSYPIIRLNFNEHMSNRRMVVDHFVDILFNLLSPLENKYHFHANQLISVILEIARNSADHTMGDAFFGIDIEKVPYGKFAKISFIFGDIGNGIHEHVKQLIPESRLKNAGIAETYRWALKRGNTSRPETGVNYGLGLPKLLNYAHTVGMQLSVFDANSRAILSSVQKQLTSTEATHKSELPHGIIRKHIFDFSRDLPFCYFGTMEAMTK